MKIMLVEGVLEDQTVVGFADVPVEGDDAGLLPLVVTWSGRTFLNSMEEDGGVPVYDEVEPHAIVGDVMAR